MTAAAVELAGASGGWAKAQSHTTIPTATAITTFRISLWFLRLFRRGHYDRRHIAPGFETWFNALTVDECMNLIHLFCALVILFLLNTCRQQSISTYSVP